MYLFCFLFFLHTHTNQLTTKKIVEFTSAKTKSFSMQLSIYIDYLIEKSLNPDDSIICKFLKSENCLHDLLIKNLVTQQQNQHNIAKNAVIRRVQSYKDSIVTSDVWLSTFKVFMKHIHYIYTHDTNNSIHRKR